MDSLLILLSKVRSETPTSFFLFASKVAFWIFFLGAGPWFLVLLRFLQKGHFLSILEIYVVFYNLRMFRFKYSMELLLLYDT